MSASILAPQSHDPADILGSDDDFLASLRQTLPERSRSVVERMDRVNSVYVVSFRDRVLSEAFDTFMEDLLATRDGHRREADLFFVTGESGAGKTEAVARVLSQHPVLRTRQTSFGAIKPYVSVKLAGYTLPRIAARQIIAASGHRVKASLKQGDAWAEMPKALRRRRVILVHIDEVQHLVGGTGSATDYEKLADAIKGVSITDGWPIGFVLSGMPQVTKLAVKDEQFVRRSRWVHFQDIDIDRHRPLVVRVLSKLSEAGGLGLGTLSEGDLPERIAHAAQYRFGRVCQLVSAAIHQALRDEKEPTELLRGHFALAYANRSRARDNNLMNPFLVDDWAALPPGAFLDAEPAGEPEE